VRAQVAFIVAPSLAFFVDAFAAAARSHLRFQRALQEFEAGLVVELVVAHQPDPELALRLV
jgi:hypothetical protein